MAPSGSLQATEQKAIKGKNESQDTQEIIDKYHKEYGVGITSSSPPTRATSSTMAGQGGTTPQPAPSQQPQLPKPHGTEADRNLKNGSQHLADSSPPLVRRTYGKSPATINRMTRRRGLLERGRETHETRLDATTPSRATSPAKNDRSRIGEGPLAQKSKTMSSCTQSTTQSNEGRSYDRYFPPDLVEEDSFLPSTAPVDDEGNAESQSVVHGKLGVNEENKGNEENEEHEEDNEDGTGVVKFQFSNSPLGDTQSSPDHELGTVDFGPGSLPRAASSQAPTTMMLPPETPANPFAANNRRSQLVPASELFKQTQFSSAFRGASPTSSRPSPDVFTNNDISPNLVVSSPLKRRHAIQVSSPDQTSSPQLDPSSRPFGELEGATPSNSKPAAGEAVVPDSSVPRMARTKPFRGPPDDYVPMKASQKMRQLSKPESDDLGGQSSSNDDDDFIRQRQARSKKETAANRLKTITFSRKHSREDEEVEVPSTNKRMRSLSPAKKHPAESQKPLSDGDGDGDSDDRHGPVTVANSQEQLPQDPPPQTRALFTSNREAIPETSPPEVRPRLLKEIISLSSNAAPKPPSIPEIPSDFLDTSLSPSLPSLQPRPSHKTKTPGGTQPLPSPSVSNQGTRTRGSLRREREMVSSNLAPPTSSAVTGPNLDSTSALSSLTATPLLSNDTTPATEDSTVSSRKPATRSHNSSPAMAKARRRDVAASDIFPKLKARTADVDSFASARVTRRSYARHSPSSTDELARSGASLVTPEQQHNFRNSNSRLGRSTATTASMAAAAATAAAHTSTASATIKTIATPSITTTTSVLQHSSTTGKNIFEGMVFAISFQSRKAGEESGVEYNGRVEHVGTIEKKIQQAGGRILTSGFDELFEPLLPIKSATTAPSATAVATAPADSEQQTAAADSDLKLTPAAARSTGFAALIADGHHRKSKYMQALALGLPCLAARWVTTCVERNEVVDWSPYLLCAGQSSFLGDAVRSRSNLGPCYDARLASLPEVLSRSRPLLLRGSLILLVMRRSEEVKKMAYVFLVRALGASLHRCYSVDEARCRLGAAEDAGRPYDWVYVDEKTDPGALFDEVPSPATTAEGGGKKKKRGGAAAAAAAAAASISGDKGPPPKKIRTLSDELVIQSLILGRLIEAGEMEE